MLKIKTKPKKPITILLTLFLITSKTLTCSPGCLKCLPNSECFICDFINHYQITPKKTCELKKMENCLYLDQNGKCLKCSQNHYKDVITSNCIKNENSIENCIFYKSSNSCSICQKGFYIKSSRCEKVKDEIDNCLVNSSETSCIECDTGFVKSLDYLSCEKIDDNTNCSLFNFVSCENCVAGFSKNQSFYKKYFLEDINIGFLVNFYTNHFSGVNTGFHINVCQKNIIDNCINFENYNKCKICLPNFFLDSDKTCKPYPKDNIQNCYKYKDSSHCSECNQGYYLTSSQEICKIDEEIENCEEYNPKSKNGTNCTLCKQAFYLSSNSCLERSNKNITNCKDYSQISDKCLICKDSFKITSDGLKCLDFIKHCFLYETTTSSTANHQCLKCNQGYYLTDSFCLKGIKNDCSIFENNDNICNKCDNTFYLDDDKNCVKHKDITSCDEYEGFRKDECDICNNNSLVFKIETMCKVTQEIEGCNNYLSMDECEICKEGFKKVLKICEKIDINLKCLVQDGVNCVKCYSGFILDKGKCLVPISYIKGNCLSDNLGSGTMEKFAASCSLCEERSIPYNFNDHFLCYEKIWIDHLISNPVLHCKKIEFIEPSTYKCHQCEDGYFVTSTGVCEQNCVSNDILTISLESSSGDYYIKSPFNCGFATIKTENCEQYSHLVSTFSGTNISPGCIKCLPNHASIIYKINDFQIKNAVPLKKIDFSINSGFATSPVAFYPVKKECVNHTANDTLVDFVLFCEYYQKMGERYKCVKCEHGKSGVLEDFLDELIKYTHITECLNMACTKIQYPGLPVELNSLVSCHECSSSKIPFLFGQAGTEYSTIKGLKSYDLTNADPISVTKGGRSVKCHTITDTSLGVKNINLPQNCAIAFMNLEAAPATIGGDKEAADADKRFNIKLNKIAIFCIACKRGRKRIFGTTDAESNISPTFLPYLVVECVEIENCSVSKWLNYCSECVYEASYLYKNGVGVDYSICKLFPIQPNCFAVEELSNGTLKCKFCAKGYTMNYDNVCEIILPPKCNSSAFKLTFKHFDFNTIAYINPEGAGCSECHTGYTPVRMTRDKETCTLSTYIEHSDHFPLDSKFITHCVNYFKQSSYLRCKNCESGFVISSDFSECYPGSNLLNCVLAESKTNCLTCKDIYISVDYSCVLKQIKNCKIYSEDFTLQNQICDKCENGFLLEENKCLYGSIPNCKQYINNINTCNICMEGYMKITDKNGNIYCFLYEPRLQCVEFDEAKFQNQILNCKKCISGPPLYLTDQNIENTLCSSFSLISNCQEYDKISTFGNSTFYCKICESGYWANNNLCVLRKNNDGKCTEFDNVSDSCSECLDGFFVSDDGSKCEENPNGIKGCEFYSSATKCVSCKKNLYLSNSICVEILEKEKIDNCLYYEDNVTCKQCEGTFFLDEKVCVKAEAKNCLEFETSKKCKSCSTDKGLKIIDDVTSCVENKDINCLDFIQVYPFICNICRKDYYSDKDGVCTKVGKIIPNCVRYQDNLNCSACKQNYILSPDLKKCSKNNFNSGFLDKNCLESYEKANPICVACNKGWYLGFDGVCKDCKLSGCAFCDHQENICLLCKSGFYMDEGKKCISYINDVNNVEVVEESGMKLFVWTFFFFFILIE